MKFISEVSWVISPLPTEQKLPREARMKISFRKISQNCMKKCQTLEEVLATDSELILAQLEPVYEIEANPTKIHFSQLFQFWVKN